MEIHFLQNEVLGVEAHHKLSLTSFYSSNKAFLHTTVKVHFKDENLIMKLIYMETDRNKYKRTHLFSLK